MTYDYYIWNRLFFLPFWPTWTKIWKNHTPMKTWQNEKEGSTRKKHLNWTLKSYHLKLSGHMIDEDEAVKTTAEQFNPKNVHFIRKSPSSLKKMSIFVLNYPVMLRCISIGHLRFLPFFNKWFWSLYEIYSPPLFDLKISTLVPNLVLITLWKSQR